MVSSPAPSLSDEQADIGTTVLEVGDSQILLDIATPPPESGDGAWAELRMHADGVALFGSEQSEFKRGKADASTVISAALFFPRCNQGRRRSSLRQGRMPCDGQPCSPVRGT